MKTTIEKQLQARHPVICVVLNEMHPLQMFLCKILYQATTEWKFNQVQNPFALSDLTVL